MKQDRYRLVRLGARGGMFYCKDTQTGARTSLETKDRKEAEKLVLHKNEAVQNPHINRRIGMAYLSASDPELCKRTWKTVMDDIIKDKEGPTLKRYLTAMKDEAHKLIEKKLLVETFPEDFKAVLRAGTVSTNVYLRRLQNHTLDMAWLPASVLPKKKFDKIKHKEARAITWEEHCRIIARQRNPERRTITNFAGISEGLRRILPACRAKTSITKNARFVTHAGRTPILAAQGSGPRLGR